MARVVYTEKQKFPVQDIILATTVVLVLVALAAVKTISGVHLGLGQIFLAVGVVAAMAVAVWYVWRTQMDISISDKNIKLKYAPFAYDELKIKWKNVENIEVVKLPRYYRWTGGNVHFSTGSKWYNINGKSVIKITMNNGEVVVIGCKNEEEVEEALMKLESVRSLVS